MAILVWHRRDLRIHDNPALAAAVATGEPILPVFILDPGILSRSDMAPVRVQFLLDSLRVLADQYHRRGASLYLALGEPLPILRTLAQQVGARGLVFNQDLEPFALIRDRAVQAAFKAEGIPVRTFLDLCLHDPEAIRTGSGTVYGVFGPFWRNWAARPKPAPYPTPERVLGVPCTSRPIPSLGDLGLGLDIPPVAAGEQIGLDLLEDFCIPERIFSYDTQRNFPAEAGTSGLSPHLRMGTVGIRQVWQATVDVEPDAYSEERLANLTTWRQELCWREFYKYTLLHHPSVVDTPYQRKFVDFQFSDNREDFERWCRGETGYPLVDAAMQQLNQAGWMHNRCRMVVASFLCKDLLLDWRWGELYFMQKLVDGDLAANNGGWQWSASMGTDAKPLRIFNPQTQLARFDPEGVYVRRWLPQLGGCEMQELAQAHTLHRYGYPQPMVDHKKQQELFKQRYSTK